MSQSLPVLTGSGSLLGITESPQSTLVGGVKGVGSAGGFSTVMSQTAVQQKAEISAEHEAGGDALPSGGVDLPLDAVQGDGLGWLNGNSVAVAVAGSASITEGLVSPSQTVEQIERFLAVELHIMQSRSEFPRPEAATSFVSVDVASQSSLVGEHRVTVVSGPEGLPPVSPSMQGDKKVDSVTPEYSAGRSQQAIGVLHDVPRETVDSVKQSSVLSGVNEPARQAAGVEAVQAPADNDREMLVNNAAPTNDALVRSSGFVESDYIPQQGGVGQQSVSSDPAEQVAAAISSEEASASAVPLAAVSGVGANVAGERQKLSAEQSVGRDGLGGRVPLEAASLTATAIAVNASEAESNSSLADRLARLQSTTVSHTEQNPFQKGANLSAVDKVIQDQGGVEHKNESAVETLAASIAATNKVAKPQSDMLQLQLPSGVKPGMQAWNQAVNERIVLLPSQNGRVVEIQLDPPELGSLQVKLQVKNDQVSVVFSAPHAAVRDALEQGMPRLREMFAEQGMSLTDSSVEDQNTRHDREGSNERRNASSGHSGIDDEIDGPITTASQGASLSLVDYYA